MPNHKITTCPKCGGPSLSGAEHLSCMATPPKDMAEVENGALVFKAGSNLEDVLAALTGSGPVRVRMEQFDWWHQDGSISVHIDVTRLRMDLDNGKVAYDRGLVPIDAEWAETLVANGSADPAYAMALSQKRLLDPVIWCNMDETGPVPVSLLCDGAHRYLAHAMRCIPEIRAYVVPFAAWQPYGVICSPPMKRA